jgi:hypothetical protein
LVSRAVLGFALLSACAEDPPPAPPEATEASAEKKPAVDQKIANAVAAAQASAQAVSPSTDQAAPPADGIMTPEAAARELAPGSAATLVLGNEGTSPRLKLGAERIAPGAGPAGKLQLSYRSGGSMMPTIEVDLKPKVASAESSTATASLGAAGAAPSAVAIRFVMANVRPAAEQPGRLPDNARAELAKMNGSWVELVSTPRGALQNERAELAGKNPGLEPFLQGTADALHSIVLPYPDVPVGVGAFWMVKSRERASGADVLAYRMVKVTELNAESAKLTVSTRRYLLTPTLPIEGLPPHQVRQFESEGNATLLVRAGAPYPETAELEDTFGALLVPGDRPNQALPFQSQLNAKLSFAP